VYVVPAGGGTRRLVVADAVTPRWSPNSKRIVFTRPSDGSLRTIDLTGTDERLTRTHDPYGDVLYSPAWSPDGQWIAFMWYGYIMKVPVDRLGQALADFTIIANDQSFNYSPAWSNNSKTVVFGRNSALWSVPATGGDYTQLTTPTAWYPGDYDPAYSNNGQYIAFARATGPLAKPVVAQQNVPPAEFGLLQNYPNPFNPATTIRYGLPADAYVSLAVYDLLGLKVAELVNERVPAGYHEVVFDASRLATGTYVYRLQAGNSVLMKKMTLVK
jgi:Tol biopolymer transport system component